ncbi:xylulokinase [Roseicitreum antarcticum]|uniref:Xylulose kinase n=1 Tax=Roseicitreum antarcticum TaxID=564137 RepID=A0A1H3BVX9_9RHOB|nr:xylulokinase [Roseicitreum antarcticum]SDX46033.1 xylulokinase [Roseicitreum antarcticum]
MYLGLDLGTSGLRALLIDAGQRIIGSASAELSVARPHPGWSEQPPGDWIAAAETAVAGLRAAHPTEFAAIRGIGLSGQMHGATLYDKADQPLSPSILWNDTRAAAEAAELDAQPDFRALTGNIVFPGFTAPKLVWVARHEPEIFRQTACVLLPKDALRLWLTGDRVSEMSDASGTSWLDVGARDWSDTLLDATGLTRDQMPGLVEGSEPSGQLRADLRAQWGLTGPVTVAGGAGDNAASAIGMGMVHAGQAFVSLGTSGVLFAANDAFSPRPESAVHAFCHALPGRWHQMGVILSATDALNWHARICGMDAAALDREVGTTLQPPGGVTFLPYLSGERTPHNDARIRGAFAGLGHEADRPALTRAVMEGVAFALADNLAALRAAGADIARVTAVGGGSQSDYWLKAIATALDMPVDLPARGDFGAAFGAARLGLMAATGATPDTVCTPPPTDRTIMPEPKLRAAFQDAHARFRRLYEVLA